MTRLYYVNPANTADITGPLEQGKRITLPDGRVVESLDQAIPEWDVYEATEDNTQTPQYHRFERTDTVFVGTVKNPAARVQETRVFSQLTLDELYGVKLQELEFFTRQVFYSHMKMTAGGGVDFWVRVTQQARDYRTSVDAYYQWNPPPPWRNIPVWIYRVSNGNLTRTKVDQSDWEALKEAQGRFDIDVGYSTDEVRDVMDAAYAVPDWNALAAIDVETAPTTNPWPDYTLDPTVGSG